MSKYTYSYRLLHQFANYCVVFCISSQTNMLFSASVRKLLCCFCRGRRRLAMQNVVPSYTSAPNRFRVNKEPVWCMVYGAACGFCDFCTNFWNSGKNGFFHTMHKKASVWKGNKLKLLSLRFLWFSHQFLKFWRQIDSFFNSMHEKAGFWKRNKLKFLSLKFPLKLRQKTCLQYSMQNG